MTFDRPFRFHSSPSSIFCCPLSSLQVKEITIYLFSRINTCYAGCKGELGILMDESGSVGGSEFVKEKNFVSNLANSFTNFGPNGVQMGVITYSSDAKLDIRLNQYSNKMNFINAVKSISYRGRRSGCVIHFKLRVLTIGFSMVIELSPSILHLTFQEDGKFCLNH